jgi:type IV pilus assembly protein PilA
MVLGNLPATSSPLVSIRVNLPDGVLYRSLRDSSLKQEIVMAGIYNPVTVGMMAAMAIPAFQKVRANSQDKAIENNLRQLASAAEQFYLENGVETTTYDQLVGPDKYIRELESIAGEDYREVQFKSGEPLVVHASDGREFSHSP